MMFSNFLSSLLGFQLFFLGVFSAPVSHLPTYPETSYDARTVIEVEAASEGYSSITFKEQNAEGDGWQDTQLNEKHITAITLVNQFNQNQIEIEFNEEGSKLFASTTERNLGKQIAIYGDDNLLSSPYVNEQITGGKAIITNGYDQTNEMKTLASKLKSALN